MSTSTQISEWLHPSSAKRPEIKIGSTVRVHQKIKEGDKERVQIFEGLVIKKNGSKPDNTITVRRTVGGIGIEKIVPVMSANIEKIDIVKEAKVRRAKLYYMRGRTGKAARLSEKYLTDEERDEILKAQSAEEIAEEAPIEEQPAEEAKEETKQEVEKEEKTEEAPTEEKPAEENKEEVKEEASSEESTEDKKE